MKAKDKKNNAYDMASQIAGRLNLRSILKKAMDDIKMVEWHPNAKIQKKAIKLWCKLNKQFNKLGPNE